MIRKFKNIKSKILVGSLATAASAATIGTAVVITNNKSLFNVSSRQKSKDQPKNEAIPVAGLEFETIDENTCLLKGVVTGFPVSSYDTLNVPSSATVEGTTKTVVAIGDNAFKNNKYLTTVSIPSTVTTIGTNAFCYNKSLTTVTLGHSGTSEELVIGASAFDSCIKLASFPITDGITEINKYAFRGCASLVALEPKSGEAGDLPSLTTLGSGAFRDCSKFKGIHSGSTYQMSIPSSVTRVSNGLFQNCISLEKVIWNATAEAIPGYAFYNCSSLTDVTIGDVAQTNITEIQTYAFAKTAIKNINSSDDEVDLTGLTALTTLGSHCFAECLDITSFKIDCNTVIELGNGVFSNCYNIRSLTFANLQSEASWTGQNIFENVGIKLNSKFVTTANGNASLFIKNKLSSSLGSYYNSDEWTYTPGISEATDYVTACQLNRAYVTKHGYTVLKYKLDGGDYSGDEISVDIQYADTGTSIGQGFLPTVSAPFQEEGTTAWYVNLTFDDVNSSLFEEGLNLVFSSRDKGWTYTISGFDYYCLSQSNEEFTADDYKLTLESGVEYDLTLQSAFTNEETEPTMYSFSLGEGSQNFSVTQKSFAGTDLTLTITSTAVGTYYVPLRIQFSDQGFTLDDTIYLLITTTPSTQHTNLDFDTGSKQYVWQDAAPESGEAFAEETWTFNKTGAAGWSTLAEEFSITAVDPVYSSENLSNLGFDIRNLQESFIEIAPKWTQAESCVGGTITFDLKIEYTGENPWTETFPHLLIKIDDVSDKWTLTEISTSTTELQKDVPFEVTLHGIESSAYENVRKAGISFFDSNDNILSISYSGDDIVWDADNQKLTITCTPTETIKTQLDNCYIRVDSIVDGTSSTQFFYTYNDNPISIKVDAQSNYIECASTTLESGCSNPEGIVCATVYDNTTIDQVTATIVEDKTTIVGNFDNPIITTTPVFDVSQNPTFYFAVDATNTTGLNTESGSITFTVSFNGLKDGEIVWEGERLSFTLNIYPQPFSTSDTQKTLSVGDEFTMTFDTTGYSNVAVGTAYFCDTTTRTKLRNTSNEADQIELISAVVDSDNNQFTLTFVVNDNNNDLSLDTTALCLTAFWLDSEQTQMTQKCWIPVNFTIEDSSEFKVDTKNCAGATQTMESNSQECTREWAIKIPQQYVGQRLTYTFHNSNPNTLPSNGMIDDLEEAHTIIPTTTTVRVNNTFINPEKSTEGKYEMSVEFADATSSETIGSVALCVNIVESTPSTVTIEEGSNVNCTIGGEAQPIPLTCDSGVTIDTSTPAIIGYKDAEGNFTEITDGSVSFDRWETTETGYSLYVSASKEAVYERIGAKVYTSDGTWQICNNFAQFNAINPQGELTTHVKVTNHYDDNTAWTTHLHFNGDQAQVGDAITITPTDVVELGLTLDESEQSFVVTEETVSEFDVSFGISDIDPETAVASVNFSFTLTVTRDEQVISSQEYTGLKYEIHNDSSMAITSSQVQAVVSGDTVFTTVNFSTDRFLWNRLRLFHADTEERLESELDTAGVWWRDDNGDFAATTLLSLEGQVNSNTGYGNTLLTFNMGDIYSSLENWQNCSLHIRQFGYLQDGSESYKTVVDLVFDGLSLTI